MPVGRSTGEDTPGPAFPTGEDVHLLVVPEGAGDPYGRCSLTGFDHGSGSTEVGYATTPEAWRRAAPWGDELRCGYAFEGRRRGEVMARVQQTNPAAAPGAGDGPPPRRGPEKAGFTREARLRKDAFVEGEHVAVLLYGYLREEWTGGERPGTTERDTPDGESKRA